MVLQITYPRYSELLAEELGIHYGDGYMKIKTNKWGKHYEYSYSAHTYDDKDYIQEVKKILRTLYNLNGYERTKGNSYELMFSSRELVNFKLSMGASLSPKMNLKIPEWIQKDNNFISSFLRGIFDTDGYLTFKNKNNTKHKYPYIGISFKDFILINQIAKLITKFSISFSMWKEEKLDKRNGKINIKWAIGISGEENLIRYIENIGFRNRKHITKYLLWKNLGYCPPRTTTEIREKMLKCGWGDLNLRSPPYESGVLPG